MNDRIFFPLALLVAISLVWLAIWEPGAALPDGSVSGAATDYRVIRVAGPDLNRFEAGPAARKRVSQGADGLVLTVSATDASFARDPEGGPHFRLAPDIEAAFSGRLVRVNVRARSAGSAGATAFEMAYSTGPEGRSRWQRFDLTPSFANYAFDYEVPAGQAGLGVDFIGIRPVPSPDATSIEIESLMLVNLTLWRQTGN